MGFWENTDYELLTTERCIEECCAESEGFVETIIAIMLFHLSGNPTLINGIKELMSLDCSYMAYSVVFATSTVMQKNKF